MAKTLLKMVLGIVCLAAIFFAGIHFWEKYRQKSTAPSMETTEEAVLLPSIREIHVVPSGDGAIIQIDELGSPNYRVIPTTRPHGFVIEIPSAQVTMAPNVVARPHALVPLIEAVPTFSAGISSAKIRVELVPGTTFKDRLVGSTLFVDVARSTMAETKATPTAKPKVAVAKKKVRKKARRKAIRRKKKVVRTSKPKKRKRVVHAPTPKPSWEDDDSSWEMPTPLPSSGDDAELMQELGLEDPMVNAPKAEPTLEEPAVMGLAPDAPVKEDAAEDLSSFYYEEPTPSQVAATQPLSSGRFDMSEVTKDLPSIRAIEVFSEQGVTTVQIQRDQKTKYQVFRMVNPPRVIIDFKDALNQLRTSYPGFAGTRVQKVTTKQFTGPEGTISRIVLFVDGKTEYKQEVKGSTFILRLP